MAYLNSALSLIQFILFLPLLFFFSWQLGAGVLVVLLPVAAISKLRVAILGQKGGRWNTSMASSRLDFAAFTRDVEFTRPNGKFSDSIKDLGNTLNMHEKTSRSWEVSRAVFPIFMELFFFLLLMGLTGLMWSKGLLSSGQSFEFVPFAVLLIMMYKPVKEWSRHYPVYKLGEDAWETWSVMSKSLHKHTPPPSINWSSSHEMIFDCVSFGYDDDAKPVQGPFIIKNLSVCISSEDTTLIQGVNGAGKTTLLRLITRQEYPGQGNIIYPSRWSSGQGLSLSYLPQNCALGHGLISGLQGFKKQYPAAWVELDDILCLEPVLNSLSQSSPAMFDYGHGQQSMPLSGGQAQRLCLARVFTSMAAYLVLDEPTTWLPAPDRRTILSRLFSFWKQSPHRAACVNSGIMLCSHEDNLTGLCDRVLELSPKGIKEKNYEELFFQDDSENDIKQTTSI